MTLMNPMEQIPLDLGDHEKQVQPEVKEVALETLGNEELAALYHEAVGKDPKARLLKREELITGIQDPEAELERLGRLDLPDEHIGRYH